MEKFVQLTYIFIGLKFFEDGPIFSGKASQGRGSFARKHRPAEGAKTKAYIFFYKNLQTVSLKATQPLQCHELLC